MEETGMSIFIKNVWRHLWASPYLRRQEEFLRWQELRKCWRWRRRCRTGCSHSTAGCKVRPGGWPRLSRYSGWLRSRPDPSSGWIKQLFSKNPNRISDSYQHRINLTSAIHVVSSCFEDLEKGISPIFFSWLKWETEHKKEETR